MRINERTRERFFEWQRQAGIVIGLRDCLVQLGMQNVVKLEAVGKDAVVCETNTDTERYVLRLVRHGTVLVDDNEGKRKIFQVQNGAIQKCS